MDFVPLIRIAEQTVEAVRRKLPAPLQAASAGLPVTFLDWPSEEILGDEFEPDILGLFVGPPHGAGADEYQGTPAQILLFVGNIWDFSEGDRAVFRDEVRVTYLHELGHYFGWDEDTLEAQGLA